jgi:hypothetical protein
MKGRKCPEENQNRAETVFEAPCNPSPEPSPPYAARSALRDGNEGKTEIFLRL